MLLLRENVKSKKTNLREKNREFNRVNAVSANVSKEEASKIKERSRAGMRAPRTGGNLELDDIIVDPKSDESEVDNKNVIDTKESPKNRRKQTKRVGKKKKGDGNCKCVIF